MMRNELIPFVFENNVAHGAIVHIEDGLEAFLAHRNYSDDVRNLVAQAMAAVPLFTTHMSFEGRINLQFQGEKKANMDLLVAQTDHHLNVRGMAKAPPELSGDFTTLLWDGLLALMIEPDSGQGTPTQALVPIIGGSLAEALQGYFDQSEQLPTLIRLVNDGKRACAFMLQRLPLRDATGTEDDWDHLRILASTLTPEELLDLPAERVLGRLFAEDPLRLHPPRPIQVACRCSPAGIERMLQSLGRAEIDSIIEEQGQVEVTCEFCGREYRYDAAEAAALFTTIAPGSPSVH